MKAPITRILVPLDPSEFAQAATETACLIATKHQAQVAGIAVLDLPEIQSHIMPAAGPYYPFMGDAIEKETRHADRVLKDCLTRFAQTCDAADVPHLETEYTGIPAQKFLESSIFYDLIVTGLKNSFHFGTREEGDPLHKLLDRTIAPVLAVPSSGTKGFQKVLIAFDGSFGSARAMQDFVSLALPYDLSITVAVADKPEKETSFLLRQAIAYLRAHGLSRIETLSSDGPIEEVITDSVLDASDLVVAGIHSRKFIRDCFIGSFTNQLMKRGDTPLFLSH
ncbi:MAG: universal stress protein [Verrucomicrobiota bacterium]